MEISLRCSPLTGHSRSAGTRVSHPTLRSLWINLLWEDGMVY